MEILMAVIIGVLFASATYLFLSKSLLRIIIASGLLSHGVHLLLITMGGLKTGAAPIVNHDGIPVTDPLPQALILTAIVISFGVTALFLVLAYRSYQELGTDNMDQLRGTEDHD